jgi:hypothetical protein
VDISSCGPLPPGGGLSFKCMLAEGRERRLGLDWIVAGVVSLLTPRPTVRCSQLRCSYHRRRALMLERTAATTLPVLQSQRRSHCVCCAAVPSKCLQLALQGSLSRPALNECALLKLPAAGSPNESRRATFAPHLSMPRCRSMRVDVASRCPPAPPHWSRAAVVANLGLHTGAAPCSNSPYCSPFSSTHPHPPNPLTSCADSLLRGLADRLSTVDFIDPFAGC